MKTLLLPALLALLRRMAQAFTDPRPRPRVLDLALGWLCGEVPKTLTSALDWLNQRPQDWSAAYRLLSQDHWERAAVRAARKRQNLSVAGAEELARLREALDRLPGGRERLLLDAVDGGYANRTFLVAVYAALLLVSLRVLDDQRNAAFEPLPAWRRQPPLRPSLRDLITLLRKEAAAYVPHGHPALAA